MVISPEHMHTLHRGGIKTKAHLARCLFHTANRASSRHIISTLTLAKPDAPRPILLALGAFLTAVALLLSLIADTIALLLPSLGLSFLPLHSLVVDGLLGAPKFTSPESLHLIVAGGNAGKFSSFCAGFGVGRPPRPTANLSVASSKLIDPPVLERPTHDSSAARKSLAAALGTITVGNRAGVGHLLIDPRGFKGPTTTTGAIARPTSLATEADAAEGGRVTVGLLDISKPGGSVLLDELEKKLRADCPSLRCVRYRKPTFSRPMPPNLAAQMASQCRVAVAALAD